MFDTEAQLQHVLFLRTGMEIVPCLLVTAGHFLPVLLTFLPKQTNSVALVRERTILTERPPPVGEVSANFLRVEGCHVVSATGPNDRFLCFLDLEPLLFRSSSSSIDLTRLTRLSGPRYISS
jgi:hypothetical protein